jgi:NADH dehydrogenase
MLGGMIARQLLAQGRDVRILVRENSLSEELAKRGLATSAQSLIEAGAKPVYGDLKDPDSLGPAAAGVDTVITTVTTTLRGGDDNLESVDLEGTIALVDAAEAAGVRHFIYTSANYANVDSPSRLLQIKAICEDQLREKELNYTILRSGFFMEVWLGAVVGIPGQAGQPVTLVGEGKRKYDFVSMQDVADYVVAGVDHPAGVYQSIGIFGSETHSWTEATQAVGKAIGRDLPINYVAPGEPVPLLDPGMAQMLAGAEMAPDTVVDMSESSATFGIEPTPLDLAMQRMFAP